MSNCVKCHEIVEVFLTDFDGYEYPWYQQLCEDCCPKRIISQSEIDDLLVE